MSTEHWSILQPSYLPLATLVVFLVWPSTSSFLPTYVFLQVSAFFSCIPIVIKKSTKLVELGTLRSILVRPGPRQWALAFHDHDCLGYVNGQGVYTIFTLGHAGFLYLKSVFGFLEGHSSFFSFFFSLRPSLLDAWASSILIYLAARGKRTSNLVAGFLAKDLKKSPSSNPCAKALALTSWVADGTSKVAVLNI
ncbi:UNVERIFIED_CONTAM: hypothetical protein Slati_0468900 [Sesamum latifolium]|uniref:Uncharacterized protein n=1 Tax=Sesamum latifolium TaxID=2727402 RepID=A0AAW2XZI6_9LAMI